MLTGAFYAGKMVTGHFSTVYELKRTLKAVKKMARQRVMNLVFESEEEYENSDEEWLQNEGIRRPRCIKHRSNYFYEYDDFDFVTRFRLSKQSVLSILEQIEQELEFPSNRNAAVSPVNQLLMALRYYAAGSGQLTIADYGGVSKSTANRIVHRVSYALARLRAQYIKMPTDAETRQQHQLQFYEVARFPKTIGALDCTHIKIKSTGGDDAERYRNRKGYFSLNVQVICTANMEFADIVARWPGSTHDSTIFNNCTQRARFEQGAYGDSVLLGDAGYPCRSYLMTPLNVTQSPQENLYNEAQIRSRNVVERLFGCWKRRFPVLALGMNLKLENIFPIITATAVLHNILRHTGEQMPPDDPQLQLPVPWEALLAEGEMGHAAQPARGRHDAVRHMIIENYFRSLIQQ